MQFYGAKIHIILYINERFMQKVKIVTLFVKPKYGKIIVPLHPETIKLKNEWRYEKISISFIRISK